MTNRIQDHFDANSEVYTFKRGHSLVEEIWRQREPLFAKFLGENPQVTRVLDVGGGNGFLADRLLESFPHLEVTIVDFSQAMLDQNIAHPRKFLVCKDLHEFFNETSAQELFDLINFDVVLHHVLSPSSFSECRRMQLEVLKKAGSLLSAGGAISIREINYQTMPGLPRRSAHRLLWFISTRRLPGFASRWLKAMGMKSQGAGVCFYDDVDLRSQLQAAGMTVKEWKAHQLLVRMNWKFCFAITSNVKDVYLIATAQDGAANGPASCGS